MSMAWCQIKPINVNFHLKKVWKFLIKIQLTKSNPKITSEVKVPCLMPIRVKKIDGAVVGRSRLLFIILENCMSQYSE